MQVPDSDGGQTPIRQEGSGKTEGSQTATTGKDSPMIRIPQGVGKDKKTGEEFTYGDFDVAPVDCGTCGGIFVDMEQHAGTTTHKAAVAAQAAV
jgi:hypothetical protein